MDYRQSPVDIRGHVLHGFLLLILCAFAPADLNSRNTPPLTLDERVEAFHAVGREVAQATSQDADRSDRRAELVAAFSTHFPEDELHELIAEAPAESVRRAFYATFDYLSSISEIDQQYETELPIIERLFAALVEQGVADDEVYRSMHHFHLTFRQFEKAAALRASRPDLEIAAPPELIASGAKTLQNAGRDDRLRPVLSLSDGALRQELFDVKAPAFVIVISHPGCGFSKAAVAAIRDDPELNDLMNAHARWVASPYTSLTDGAISKWNAENPAQSFRYADASSDWPEINYWGTPSFYFFRDGELAAKVVGWPKDDAPGRRALLRQGFRAIGIDPGDAAGPPP